MTTSSNDEGVDEDEAGPLMLPPTLTFAAQRKVVKSTGSGANLDAMLVSERTSRILKSAEFSWARPGESLRAKRTAALMINMVLCCLAVSEE